MPPCKFIRFGHEHGANDGAHAHVSSADDSDARQMDMPAKSAAIVESVAHESPVKQAEPTIHGTKDGHKHQHKYKANP